MQVYDATPRQWVAAFKWMYRTNDLGILADRKFNERQVENYGRPMAMMILRMAQRWGSQQPHRKKMSALHRAYARRR